MSPFQSPWLLPLNIALLPAAMLILAVFAVRERLAPRPDHAVRKAVQASHAL